MNNDEAPTAPDEEHFKSLRRRVTAQARAQAQAEADEKVRDLEEELDRVHEQLSSRSDTVEHLQETLLLHRKYVIKLEQMIHALVIPLEALGEFPVTEEARKLLRGEI